MCFNLQPTYIYLRIICLCSTDTESRCNHPAMYIDDATAASGDSTNGKSMSPGKGERAPLPQPANVWPLPPNLQYVTTGPNSSNGNSVATPEIPDDASTSSYITSPHQDKIDIGSNPNLADPQKRFSADFDSGNGMSGKSRASSSSDSG